MACPAEAPLDVFLFLLDDARVDQLAYLPETTARLAPVAVEFERAYVTTPLCCPSRASLLSGGYTPSRAGVITNLAPNGGATVFDDGHTLAVRMAESGYATALYGKYLNDYGLLGQYVPPGWTDWAGVVDGVDWNTGSARAGQSAADAPGHTSEEPFGGYVTEWQVGKVQAFIEAHPSEPLFVHLSFLAPHSPHTPHISDVGRLAGELYRGGAFEEADLADKPAWVQSLPLATAQELAAFDVAVQERNESLYAVDRAIVAIIDAVEAAGRGERAAFILASDNGMMWREHRLSGKGLPYEESVHVPLLVSVPGASPRVDDRLVAANLDLGATVQELAGLDVEGDGQSLVPALCDSGAPSRDHVAIQGWPAGSPPWAGVVTNTHKYVATATGEEEFYDLVTDPSESSSLHAEPEEAPRLAELAALSEVERGVTVVTSLLPDATRGEDYSAELVAWGGTEPYRWTVTRGELPGGVQLSETGAVVGTPTELGQHTFWVTVSDSSASPFHGEPQHHEAPVTLVVARATPTEPAEDCGCGGVAALPVLLVFARRQKRHFL